MRSVTDDVRYAIRMMRRRPWATAVVLVTLAIGVGANTAIFSFVDAILLRPLPYPHANRIVSLWERRPTGQWNAMSALNYLDYAHRNHTFADMAATTICCSVTILGGEPAPTPMASLKVSASYFDVLGAKAAFGRTFVSDDARPGHDHVVVLSHRVWSSRFGSDVGLIGRTIRLDDAPCTVVGVMPENSSFDRGFIEIWLPLSFEGDRLNRSSHWLLSLNGAAIGLLKPGVAIEAARADMDVVASQIAAEHPDTNKGWGVVVEPYGNTVFSADLRQSLSLATAAVVVVLLIACVNVANMLLASALARDREIVVRLALGAAPARLLRQLLTESVLLSTMGGALGVAFGYASMSALRAILRAMPATIGTLPMLIPADASVQLDGRVLAFALAVSVMSGVAFGLAPALAMVQAGVRSAASGARTSASLAHSRLRDAFVVAQVALAFVLLIGTGLLVRSFLNMRRADTGFESANVLTVAISRSEHHFESVAQVRAFMRTVVTTLRALPGVVDAAFIDSMPMNGAPRGTFVQRASDPIVERAQRPIADLKIVGPGYFRVLGLRLRRGRLLSERDDDRAPLVAVINETMAREWFPNGDPLGERLLMDGPNADSTSTAKPAAYDVVGVIADEQLVPFDDHRAHAVIYVSNEQDSRDFVGIIARTSLAADGFERAVRATIKGIDADAAVTHVRTMDQWLADSMIPDRYRSALFGILAALAVVLTAIGIYGVIAYSVAQRTREIGIRAALGATRARLVGLVVGHGAVLAAAGLAIGTVTALGLTRFLHAFLFGIAPFDVVTWSAAAVALAAVAVIACYVPARHAASVDPVAALHTE